MHLEHSHDLGRGRSRRGSVRSVALAVAVTTVALLVGGGAALTQSLPFSPDAPGQRIVLRDDGLVVTFPADWVVESEAGQVHAQAPDGHVTCVPTGTRFDEPVDDPAALLREIAAIYPSFSDDGPLPVVDASEFALPAGPAIRFIVDRDLAPELAGAAGDRYETAYFVTDGAMLIFLGCWASERPADDWLGIAESIEFFHHGE